MSEAEHVMSRQSTEPRSAQASLGEANIDLRGEVLLQSSDALLKTYKTVHTVYSSLGGGKSLAELTPIALIDATSQVLEPRMALLAKGRFADLGEQKDNDPIAQAVPRFKETLSGIRHVYEILHALSPLQRAVFDATDCLLYTKLIEQLNREALAFCSLVVDASESSRGIRNDSLLSGAVVAPSEDLAELRERVKEDAESARMEQLLEDDLSQPAKPLTLQFVGRVERDPPQERLFVTERALTVVSANGATAMAPIPSNRSDLVSSSIQSARKDGEIDVELPMKTQNVSPYARLYVGEGYTVAQIEIYDPHAPDSVEIHSDALGNVAITGLQRDSVVKYRLSPSPDQVQLHPADWMLKHFSNGNERYEGGYSSLVSQQRSIEEKVSLISERFARSFKYSDNVGLKNILRAQKDLFRSLSQFKMGSCDELSKYLCNELRRFGIPSFLIAGATFCKDEKGVDRIQNGAHHVITGYLDENNRLHTIDATALVPNMAEVESPAVKDALKSLEASYSGAGGSLYQSLGAWAEYQDLFLAQGGAYQPHIDTTDYAALAKSAILEHEMKYEGLERALEEGDLSDVLRALRLKSEILDRYVDNGTPLLQAIFDADDQQGKYLCRLVENEIERGDRKLVAQRLLSRDSEQSRKLFDQNKEQYLIGAASVCEFGSEIAEQLRIAVLQGCSPEELIVALSSRLRGIEAWIEGGRLYWLGSYRFTEVDNIIGEIRARKLHVPPELCRSFVDVVDKITALQTGIDTPILYDLAEAGCAALLHLLKDNDPSFPVKLFAQLCEPRYKNFSKLGGSPASRNLPFFDAEGKLSREGVTHAAQTILQAIRESRTPVSTALEQITNLRTLVELGANFKGALDEAELRRLSGQKGLGTKKLSELRKFIRLFNRTLASQIDSRIHLRRAAKAKVAAEQEREKQEERNREELQRRYGDLAILVTSSDASEIQKGICSRLVFDKASYAAQEYAAAKRFKSELGRAHPYMRFEMEERFGRIAKIPDNAVIVDFSFAARVCDHLFTKDEIIDVLGVHPIIQQIKPLLESSGELGTNSDSLRALVDEKMPGFVSQLQSIIKSNICNENPSLSYENTFRGFLHGLTTTCKIDNWKLLSVFSIVEDLYRGKPSRLSDVLSAAERFTIYSNIREYQKTMQLLGVKPEHLSAPYITGASIPGVYAELRERFLRLRREARSKTENVRENPLVVTSDEFVRDMQACFPEGSSIREIMEAIHELAQESQSLVPWWHMHELISTTLSSEEKFALCQKNERSQGLLSLLKLSAEDIFPEETADTRDFLPATVARIKTRLLQNPAGTEKLVGERLNSLGRSDSYSALRRCRLEILMFCRDERALIASVKTALEGPEEALKEKLSSAILQHLRSGPGQRKIGLFLSCIQSSLELKLLAGLILKPEHSEQLESLPENSGDIIACRQAAAILRANDLSTVTKKHFFLPIDFEPENFDQLRLIEHVHPRLTGSRVQVPGKAISPFRKEAHHRRSVYELNVPLGHPLANARQCTIAALHKAVQLTYTEVPLTVQNKVSHIDFSRLLRKSTSGNFHGYRNYSPGDDPRRIGWRASQRSDRLVVKTNEEEQAPAHTIYIVDIGSSFCHDLEIRASILRKFSDDVRANKRATIVPIYRGKVLIELSGSNLKGLANVTLKDRYGAIGGMVKALDEIAVLPDLVPEYANSNDFNFPNSLKVVPGSKVVLFTGLRVRSDDPMLKTWAASGSSVVKGKFQEVKKS